MDADRADLTRRGYADGGHTPTRSLERGFALPPVIFCRAK